MKYIRYCSPSPIGLASDVVRKARRAYPKVSTTLLLLRRPRIRPVKLSKAWRREVNIWIVTFQASRDLIQLEARCSGSVHSIRLNFENGKRPSTAAFGKPGWILKVPVDAASTIPLTSIRNMQFFLARNVPLAHRVGFRFQFTRELGLIASHSQSYNYWNLAWRVWISPASTLFATFKVCSRIAMV